MEKRPLLPVSTKQTEPKLKSQETELVKHKSKLYILKKKKSQLKLGSSQSENTWIYFYSPRSRLVGDVRHFS